MTGLRTTFNFAFYGRIHQTNGQLITEILVKDIKHSTQFYCQLGFALLRDGGDFVELTWEDHRLFLAELSAFHEAGPIESPASSKFPAANIRVMVSNVDDYWRLAIDMGAEPAFNGDIVLHQIHFYGFPDGSASLCSNIVLFPIALNLKTCLQHKQPDCAPPAPFPGVQRPRLQEPAF